MESINIQNEPVPEEASPQIAANDSESGFGDWYAKHAREMGIDKNPDDPRHHYDYRGAYSAGVEPDDSGHWSSIFKDEKHPNLVVDGVNTKTGQAIPSPEPTPSSGVGLQADPKQTDSGTQADPKQTEQAINSPAPAMAKAAKKWEKWDPSRGVSADEFRRTAYSVMQKFVEATGDLTFADPKNVELLALTAANETNVGRYMNAPGKSTQRGIMQITDSTLSDMFRFMQRDPRLLEVVNSLRNKDVPINRDIEENLPLSMALARVRYMYSKKEIPDDPKLMAQFYKDNYNTNHILAKATPKRALSEYEKYFVRGGV
jgi:hypothetical protein